MGAGCMKDEQFPQPGVSPFGVSLPPGALTSSPGHVGHATPGAPMSPMSAVSPHSPMSIASPMGSPISAHSSPKFSHFSHLSNMSSPNSGQSWEQLPQDPSHALLYVNGQHQSCDCAWWTRLVLLVLLSLGLAACAAFGAYRLHAWIYRPRAPEWALEIVDTIGDSNHLKRGETGNFYRDQVEAIFNGTHVKGFEPGKAGDEDFITWNAGKKIPGEFGPVILSPRAAAIKLAMEEKGWWYRTLYHGTENPFVKSILAGGFLNSDGWHGVGIYASRTFGHAECYAPGDGESIILLHVYWDPDNRTKYVHHVEHNSEINDVFVITDPLVVMPIEVQRCCPEQLLCR